MRRGTFVAASTLAALLATAAPAAAQSLPQAGCDPLDPAVCLQPWPNDYFRKDGHLALTPSMMPANSAGVPIDPTDYNRQDGFSPGATIVLKVPGLDTPAALARTGADGSCTSCSCRAAATATTRSARCWSAASSPSRTCPRST